MKNGKLNEREMATLNRAWEILSDLTEWMEQDAEIHGFEADTDSDYLSAMNAVVGLCDFINGQEVEG